MTFPVALCQDCLRPLGLHTLLQDANDPPGLCPCGSRSQTCDCKACIDMLEALTCGDLEGASTWLQPGWRVTAWSPSLGATFEKADSGAGR